MHEAKCYVQLKNKNVQCKLCPNFCLIKENELGKCSVRKNVQGKLYSLVYNNPIATAVDPIEKKPLYHFLPSSKVYSLGTIGCNFKCQFCQNWQLSRSKEIAIRTLTPEEVIKQILKNKCKSIAYTYNDPIVFLEYVIDIAKLAKKKDIKNVFVSNGYINKEPLEELCKYIDAASIDIKGFTEKFYKEFCYGKLKPILEALKIMKKKGVWIEIINLVIPTLNDNLKEIEKMCLWIKENLGEETPLHFSRFFPYYKIVNLPITPENTLLKAKEIAEKVGLKHVYIGNIEGNQDTLCWKCKKILIHRNYYKTENNIKENNCRYCNTKIAGIFK
ncbi:MAG: AmmeMemoRadiSam system radical SAM enzyme [Nanoarchaeota archaeon]|nr:AmmeMemoRadiSam system radical SAM enzyme [Nanoarchaeota archaeon]